MAGPDSREVSSNVGKVFRRQDGQLVIGSDRLTVKLVPDMSVDEARAQLEKAGLEVLRQLKFAPNLFETRVVSGQDPIELANALQESAVTVYSEPVMVEHVDQRLPFTPTDPQYGQQWQWKNNGSVGCTAGADISAEDAWGITRGAGVRIAVIDNGFDVRHEDLAPAVFAASGYFDEGPTGAKFEKTLTNFPGGSHGTFCAGMAGARANNGAGGCGAAPEADLLLIGVLNDQVGTQATLARAVGYAADPSTEVDEADPASGAHVIACSLGPSTAADWALSGVLADALLFASTHGRGGLGTPIFWATSNGNVAVSLDEVVSHEVVMAVGRSTCRDTENNSAFGPKLEFLAPGVSVFSTRPGNTYGFSTGTSFAAPCAAGVGALLLAHRPALTWQQVRQAMRDGCDKVGGATYDADGHNDDYGFGRINAMATLTAGEAYDSAPAPAAAALPALPVPDPMAHVQRLRLRAETPDDLRQFLRTHDVDAGCSGLKRHEDGTYSIEIFVPDDTRAELTTARCSVEVVENATEIGVQRQREVGRTDRFAEARGLPQGVGIKR
jgi:subtilisin family serine protease